MIGGHSENESLVVARSDGSHGKPNCCAHWFSRLVGDQPPSVEHQVVEPVRRFPPVMSHMLRMPGEVRLDLLRGWLVLSWVILTIPKMKQISTFTLGMQQMLYQGHPHQLVQHCLVMQHEKSWVKPRLCRSSACQPQAKHFESNTRPQTMAVMTTLRSGIPQRMRINY